MTADLDFSVQSDLFLESLIKSYVTNNPRFLRRDWLAAEVEAGMAESNCRFVLLTAEPGAGKSAFMAQLATDHPTWPRYFIRRDQHMPLEDGGARGFLEKIGFQLAALYPEAFQTDAVRVSISQVVESSSGQITGADVDELVASPFYSKVFEITQEVKANQGNLTGIRVHKLVTDRAQISLLDLQRMAILAPALALQQQGHTEPIVILIDALDELRYRPLSDTVLDWLIRLRELPANVRVLVTSRPDLEWLAWFRSQQGRSLVEKTIPQVGEDICQDLTDYAGKLVAIPEVESFLMAHKRPEQSPQAAMDQFVVKVVKKAGGNLGYLDAVGRAIDQAVAGNDLDMLKGLLELEQLPGTLKDLYGHFLKLLRGSVGDTCVTVEDPTSHVQGLVNKWTNLYRPVLGVLAVTMEPLTISQIRRLGRMLAGEDDVSEAIGWLRQFLAQQGSRFTFYHSTLPEFLVSQATQENPEFRDLAVDPAVWHERIVASYRGPAVSWDQVDWSQADDYGLAHVPEHLSLAGLDLELRALLIHYHWLQAKLDRLGANALLLDFSLGQRPIDDTTFRLSQVLDQSTHVLAQDPAQLAPQLLGRLMDDDSGLQALLSQARTQCGIPCLLPYRASLRQASVLVRTMVGHTGGCTGVALSRDGSVAVSASTDTTLKVWDVKKGEELRTLKGHEHWVAGVVLSKDGNLAVSASLDGTLKVWDVKKGKELRTIEGHTGNLNAVVLSENNGIAVSASSNNTLQVWDVESGQEVRTLKVEGDKAFITGVALSADGRLAISSLDDGMLQVWDVTCGKVLRTLEGDMVGGYNFYPAALSGDGRLAVQPLEDNTLRVWDVMSGEELRKLSGHWREPTAVAVNVDGSLAISASDDRTLKIWNVTTGEGRTIPGYSDRVRGIAMSEDGRMAISASLDKTLKVWNLTDIGSLGTHEDHMGEIRDLVMSEDGKLCISASFDGTLKVWEVDSGKELRKIEDRAPIMCLAINGDGTVAISAPYGESLRVWDVANGNELRTLEGHSDVISGVALSADGKVAVSANCDNEVKVWDVASGKELPALVSRLVPCGPLAISSDGRLAVAALEDNSLMTWEVHSGKVLNTFAGHTDMVNDVVLGCAGRLAISGSTDHTLKVWDLVNGWELATLKGHAGSVRGVAVTPDGQRVVSTSEDNTVKVWDISASLDAGSATGACFATFHADGPLFACAISPDKHTIIAAGKSGKVHFLRFEE